MRLTPALPVGEVGIEKPKGMGRADNPRSLALLRFLNLSVQFHHFRPMLLRAIMMLGVVTVVHPSPVVELVISAHAPRNWLVRVCAEVFVIAVQRGKSVPEVIEGQKEDDELPVENAKTEIKRNHRDELALSLPRFLWALIRHAV